MKNKDMRRKVYSPDISEYSFEGTEGLFKTVSSIFIGPLRLLMRVMHNIMILPAELLASYSNALLLVSGAMAVLGILDYLVFHKWPLLVSQIPAICIALWFRKKASSAVARSEELREVNINVDEVQEMCNEIYKELDSMLGKGDK